MQAGHLTGSQDDLLDMLISQLEEAKKALEGAVNEILGLQATLAQANTALLSIAQNTCCDTCQEAALVAKAALAAQKGGDA